MLQIVILDFTPIKILILYAYYCLNSLFSMYYLYSFPVSSNVMVELLIFIDLEEQVKHIYSTY